ncbi:MAG: hypothetical protein NVS1B10_05670 [Candidatus Saccharimonadales bacterium]
MTRKITTPNINRSTFDKDPILYVQLTVLFALVLQLTLPDRFVAGPRFVLPVLEAFLVISLYVTSRKIDIKNYLLRRFNSITLIVLIAIANGYALQRLAHLLLAGSKVDDGHGLILAAVNIFLTNIIVFALLYWEIDAGGPDKRLTSDIRDRDFSFPQMQNPELAPKNWLPNFVDYLYVSATNATAFSPTDTMPLTRVAKIFMLTQSLISLTALALVASRAVNILK